MAGDVLRYATEEDRDKLPEAMFEGFWARWECPECSSVCEHESDIRRHVVKCDVCGTEAVVVGD